MKLGTAQIIRANSRDLPLADNSIDLVVTSPPYFALRSYQDGGEHYAGQIGDEPTPAEFVESLLEVTRECVRVLKPSGSLWVNLGDKYSQRVALRPSSHQDGLQPEREGVAKDWKASKARGEARMPYQNVVDPSTGRYVPEKSLIGIPWRYALRCIDDLGLILRAEVIWSKPNGLPESVTDRVRRSHEQWFHFTLQPRYFSAVDEIREGYAPETAARYAYGFKPASAVAAGQSGNGPTRADGGGPGATNPLGKLPGSVWTIPTQPLRVPEHLGVDHFAAFPMEWPRRIIKGWAPTRGVCVECGEGRRPVTTVQREGDNKARRASDRGFLRAAQGENRNAGTFTITGEACACPEPTAPTRPAVVLDPFGGTGTTALLAKALGCHGINVDMSADYCRLAQWRTNDEGELARALHVDKPAKQIDGQGSLLDLLDGGAA